MHTGSGRPCGRDPTMARDAARQARCRVPDSDCDAKEQERGGARGPACLALVSLSVCLAYNDMKM